MVFKHDAEDNGLRVEGRFHRGTLIGFRGEWVIGFRGERVIGLVENPHRLCRMRALSEQRTQRRLRDSLEYFRTTGVISYYRVYNRLLPIARPRFGLRSFFIELKEEEPCRNAPSS
jgi:hypothetical protein